MFLAVVLFIVGLVIIIISGDKFVDSAVILAQKTGIPKMVIGATLVSLATTLPEFTVSSIAALSGSPQMAIGNAIGSVICNTAFISSLTLIFMPGEIQGGIKKKGIMLLAPIAILMVLTLDGSLNLIESILLYGILIYYMHFNIVQAKTAIHDEQQSDKVKDNSNSLTLVFVFILSVIGIVIGSNLLIDNGTIIATNLGVPESVIALTMVALGTSLPELTTTVTAIVKKEKSLSIGNIIGANLLNIVMILSTGAVLSGGSLPLTTQNVLGTPMNTTMLIDFPLALLVSVIFIVPTLITGKTKRWQGFVLITLYIAYLAFQFIFVK